MTRQGEIISRGKIRVDARKAVAKLREHLLIDLRDYVLELTRAAIAAGADTIEITYDANDFTIGWTAEPIPPETLVKLLDYVLSDATDNRARRLRLLALGVNAAMGLKPRWVDVYTAGTEADPCTRIRFVPSMLDDTEEMRPVSEPVPLPDGMVPGGLRVHLRERLSWHVVKRATGLAAPPELDSLAEACVHLPATILVNGLKLDARSEHKPLLRVPFDVPGCTRAFLEIMPPEWSVGVLNLLEQGVRLDRHGWSSKDIPGTAVDLPVRVVVDARTLPTNASRSEVRRESSLYRHIAETSRAALATTLHALITNDELPDDVELLSSTEAAAIAAARFLEPIVAAWIRGEQLTPAALELLDAPVLRNGCGEPLAYSQLKTPVQVYRAQQPLEEELSLWMRNVVWLRGVPAERGLESMTLHDVGNFIERAREGVERRNKFLAHEPSEVAVVHSPDHVARARFSPGDKLEGLRGEVALCNVPVGTRGPVIRIFHEDRPLEVRTLDAEHLPLPLDIALAWKHRFIPTWGFDGVQESDELRVAIGFAIMAGVELTARQAPLLDRRPELRPLLRAAIGTILQAADTLGIKTTYDPRTDVPMLFEAAIWPTTQADRFVSVSDLEEQLDHHGAVFYASRETAGSAVDKRIVVTADHDERKWLRSSLVGAVWVRYERGILDASAEVSWPQRRDKAIETAHNDLLSGFNQPAGDTLYIEFSEPGLRGRIGMGTPARRVVLHAGHHLATTLHSARFGTVHLIICDNEVVPNENWDDILINVTNEAEAETELELLLAITAALEGDVAARDRIRNWPDPISVELRRYVLQSVSHLRNELALLDPSDEQRRARDELYNRLLAAPLLTMLDAHGAPRAASLLQVQQAHPFPAAIPALVQPPGFATLDWRPLLEPNHELWQAVAKAVGTRVEDGVVALSERRQAAVNEQRRLELLAKPSEQLARMSEDADPSSPIAEYDEGTGSERVEVAVALPAAFSATTTKVELLYLRRFVWSTGLHILGLPLVARVNVHDPHVFVNWTTLSRGSVDRFDSAVIDPHPAARRAGRRARAKAARRPLLAHGARHHHHAEAAEQRRHHLFRAHPVRALVVRQARLHRARSPDLVHAQRRRRILQSDPGKLRPAAQRCHASDRRAATATQSRRHQCAHAPGKAGSSAVERIRHRARCAHRPGRNRADRRRALGRHRQRRLRSESSNRMDERHADPRGDHDRRCR